MRKVLRLYKVNQKVTVFKRTWTYIKRLVLLMKRCGPKFTAISDSIDQ